MIFALFSETFLPEIRLSSLFDKTASKEAEDVQPGAAIFERVYIYIFFFSPNIETFPE